MLTDAYWPALAQDLGSVPAPTAGLMIACNATGWHTFFRQASVDTRHTQGARIYMQTKQPQA